MFPWEQKGDRIYFVKGRCLGRCHRRRGFYEVGLGRWRIAVGIEDSLDRRNMSEFMDVHRLKWLGLGVHTEKRTGKEASLISLILPVHIGEHLQVFL